MKKDKRKGYIYLLLDPDTLVVEYVGQTVQKLTQRYRQHIHSGKFYGDQRRVNKWIERLLNEGKCPIIKSYISCYCSPKKLDFYEIKTIKKFKKKNKELKNSTPGGSSWFGAINTKIVKKSDSIPIKGSSFETWPKIVEFKSINQACKFLGLLNFSVYDVLNNQKRHTKGWFFCYKSETLNYPRNEKQRKRICCSNGQTYSSMSDAAKHTGRSRRYIRKSSLSRCKSKDLYFWFESDSRPTEMIKSNRGIKVRCHQNKREYRSISEASKKTGIHTLIIRKILVGDQKKSKGLSFEYCENNRNFFLHKKKRYLVFTNKKKKQIVKFKTYKEAQRFFKVSSNSISYRISNPLIPLKGYLLSFELFK